MKLRVSDGPSRTPTTSVGIDSSCVQGAWNQPLDSPEAERAGAASCWALLLPPGIGPQSPMHVEPGGVPASTAEA